MNTNANVTALAVTTSAVSPAIARFRAVSATAALSKDWQSRANEEDIFEYICACIHMGGKVAINYCRNPQELDFYIKAIENNNKAEYISEVWLGMTDEFNKFARLVSLMQERIAKGKKPYSLTTLLCMKARNVLEAAYRSRGKSAPLTAEDSEGNEYDMLSDPSDLEDDFCRRSQLHEIYMACDDRDRKLVTLLYYDNGLTEAALGAKIGISGPAVHKRIKKLRGTFEAAGLKPRVQKK